MKSNIAPSIYFDDLSSTRQKPLPMHHVARVGMSAQCIDRLMLHCYYNIVARVLTVASQFNTSVEYIALQFKHFPIGCITQIDKLCHM
jgi:hypothetical protein